MTTDSARVGDWVRAEGAEVALAGREPWLVGSLFSGPDGLGDGIWVTRDTQQKSGGVATEGRRLAHYRHTAPPSKQEART